MRKNNLFLILLFMMYILNSVHLFCKSPKLGIKAGIINAWTRISGDLPGIQLKSINGLSGGLYLCLNFRSSRFGIQPEILYVTKGFDAREADQEQEISSKYKITYFELPVLLTLKLFSHRQIHPVLLLGPYFGLPGKVREIQTIAGQTEERDLGDNLKQTDMGMIIGFDIRYKLKTFFLILAVRYHWGMTSISRDIQSVSYDLDKNDSIKNRSLSLMFGVAINLKDK